MSDYVDVFPNLNEPGHDWDPEDRATRIRLGWEQAERAVGSRDHLLLEAACALLRQLVYGEEPDDDGGRPREREVRSIPARYECAGRGRPYRPADTEDDGDVQ